MTAAETSGWSPRATRTAPASAPIAANPTWSELDRPRSGSGLTTRRALPQSIAASMRSASFPARPPTPRRPPRPVRPARAGGPADPRCREQLAATKARTRPGGEHESHGPLGHIGIFPLPWGRSSLAAVDADHPQGRPAVAKESVTDDHRARPDARRRPPGVRERSRSGNREKAQPPRPPFDQRTQLACGSGFAVAVIGLLGSLIGAWTFDFTGLILIVAGLVAFGTAYVSFGREVWRAHRREARPDPGRRHHLGCAGHPVRGRDPGRPGSTWRPTAASSGLVLTLGLGIAGVILYYAATEWWSGGPAAPWTSALASGARPTRFVLIGAALVLIGWLGNVTIGFWFLRAGAEVITLILLAALVMRAEADPDEPLRLPIPASFVALGLAIIGAIIAIQHTLPFIDQGGGIDDWICLGGVCRRGGRRARRRRDRRRPRARAR